jgi:hypothetical protein
MHDCFGFRLEQCAADLLASRHVAADESRALIDRPAMAFAQIVENNDLVALIEQKLDANAPDITRAADDKDFHPRKVRRALRLSKESPLKGAEDLLVWLF